MIKKIKLWFKALKIIRENMMEDAQYFRINNINGKR